MLQLFKVALPVGVNKRYSRTQKRKIEVDMYTGGTGRSPHISQTVHQSMLMPIKLKKIYFINLSWSSSLDKAGTKE